MEYPSTLAKAMFCVSAGFVSPADTFGRPHIVESHNMRAGVEEMNGMQNMELHVLERALTAACIIAAIAVVWWGFKIMAT
jgi:hypothetical protein